MGNPTAYSAHLESLPGAHCIRYETLKKSRKKRAGFGTCSFFVTTAVGKPTDGSWRGLQRTPYSAFD